MRYISIFSGIEAASVAFQPLGWEPVAFSEIDPFPSAVLAERFPDIPNLGDITKVNWKRYRGKAELVVGGSPCFPGGSLILTENGYRPIEAIAPGDMVVTHKGRLRMVVSVGSKIADTIILQGQGSDGIECTPNHPFLSREKHRTWVNEERKYKYTPSLTSAWKPASEMEGKFWFNVCEVTGAEMPTFDTAQRGTRGRGYIEDFDFTPEFFYMVGRWLGDGWANVHRRKGRIASEMKRVYICCAFDRADELEEKLSSCGIHFGRCRSRTAERFTASSTQLYDWLVGNFGVHATGKNIPAWVLGMPENFRRELLRGYLESDGCWDRTHYSSCTVSKPLALGMKAIAGTLGYTTSIHINRNKRQASIEGRPISERPTYTMGYWTKPRSSFFAGGGWFGKVRKVLPGHRGVMVYNLEVEEDHSYTVDGVAVHNCQSFSIAGKREGLKGESGLMFEFIRCVREVRPRWFIWENVPGALSSEHGAAFGQLLHEMADGGGYGCAWRVLDAQFFGVAQRRRRLFLVGRAGDGFREACQVLFEPDCMPGNYASSKAKRAELASRAGRSPRAAGFCNRVAIAANQRGEVRLDGADGQTVGAIPATRSGKQLQGVLTPWDVQSKRVYSQDACGPTLSSGTREGVNIQPIALCMASGQANAEVGEDVGTTLSARQYKDPPITVVTRCGCDGGGKGALTSEDVSLTLSTRNEQSLFDPGSGPRYVVRRLTPVECERLQGFPDDWTKVPYKGKPAEECHDGPRYKAIGNSMAVPVMRWIGERIQMVEEEQQ